MIARLLRLFEPEPMGRNGKMRVLLSKSLGVGNTTARPEGADVRRAGAQVSHAVNMTAIAADLAPSKFEPGWFLDGE